ncbi:Glycoside hydrolase family 13 domain protein [Desulfosarcina cetonica]|nr:Glycoside hydrolase family 13 domain protein [Desulfosarcina cetonica]
MGIRKQFLKSKPVCKVTFNIPETIGNGAAQAFLVGEFNAWSTSATPMKKMKNGGFKVTLDLETGRTYQFRYLIGESHWENDPDADASCPTPYEGSRNSVIQL